MGLHGFAPDTGRHRLVAGARVRHIRSPAGTATATDAPWTA